MKEINDLLKKNDLKSLSYRKCGNSIIVDTDIGKLVIKKNNNKNNIFDYLNNRNFKYYPEIIDSNDYIIFKYIEDSNIPSEQKIFDLIELVSLLHLKTTYYKNVSVDEYKKIYEDLSNNFEYLYEYYNDLITVIDNIEYMSPSEYLFARNISFIFESINEGKRYVSNWLDQIKDLTKMRVCVVHNNLNLSHFINNNLISWDKSKIDMPIFDLFNLFNNHFDEYNFFEILKKYEKEYPLKDYEMNLLFILLIMPNKIELNKTEYENCLNITKEINRINISKNLINEYKRSTK